MADTQIIIVDDHPLFRDAMKAALSASAEKLVISEAGSLDEATARLGNGKDCDLILLDLKMPGVQGLSGLAYLRAQYPDVPVAIVSGQEETAIVRRAMALGASGYIPKSTSADVMRAAVAAILAGDVWAPATNAEPTAQEREIDDLSKRLATLTPQQVRVLMMLRAGLLNKQIAYELDVSEATVKAHVSAILLKLNVDSRTQAVIAAGKIDGETLSE
jgi:DNA-binding NarL/FixJ family response regulator